MARAVFLDRDGTLIENIPYLSDPASVRLLPGSAEALKKLRSLGFLIVVVTNQSGIARGCFPESALPGIHGRIGELLLREGAGVDAFYYCPHGPAEEGFPGCRCRKPAPGMGIRASEELGIDLRNSWMIGDSPSDLRFASNCGCPFVLVRTGWGKKTEREISPFTGIRENEKSGTMFFIADDLRAAAGIIEQAETGFSTERGGFSFIDPS
ncbi:MAG TPA: HAD family hydrolase [Aminivibrio sp.]|uniref:D-glycero-alpha-D-manno-heptose-1,7-bisphosphate 7-phosphatase n=1 Tax=Aminivibrio sp. TaxID=1872489 RepID=UPI002B1F3AA1|nr:HAD family hydrolase [Aminivibrio sp.]MEA4953605.1 HAD family hydrolase [Aminivibrio sp.]HPF84902.1 HAD family hydrolase [Aminivibrio sp.]